jgi:vacuolar-type H+-ATPase catalytic subunit A/Vma1
MKKSELKSFIKEEILSSLKEGVWSVMPERIPEFIKAIEEIKQEFHSVVGSDDVYDGLDRAVQAAKDLMAMKNEANVDEASKEDVVNQINLNKELAKTVQLSKQAGLNEAEDEDEFDMPDKEPSKAELKKTKGLAKAKDELAILVKDMKSLARKYKEAEGAAKEKIVADLKKKTALKKELESIVNKGL